MPWRSSKGFGGRCGAEVRVSAFRFSQNRTTSEKSREDGRRLAAGFNSPPDVRIVTVGGANIAKTVGQSVAAQRAPRKPEDKAMMVSPYLKRPVRSLDEVLQARPENERIDAVIAHSLADAEAAGHGPPDQINQAVAALRRLYPGLSTRDALVLVRQIRAKRERLS